MLKMRKYCVPISSFFNHTIFASQNYMKESLTVGVGNVLLKIPSQNDNCSKRYLLDFSNIQANTHDNVTCNGQVVFFPCIQASYIGFVGFSELGTISDRVTISGEKGYEKNINIVMKTIHTTATRFALESDNNKKCKVAMTFEGIDGQMHHFYCWKSYIGICKVVNKIILPVNSTIHLVNIILMI